MNEILELRIAAVQAGKDMTHAQILAKRNLREQLDDDVAKFLAKGGKVKELATGFSHFKDGIVPQRAGKVAMSDEERIEREKVIEAKNAEIRRCKAALKQQRQLEIKQRHDAQIKEQINLLASFERKSVNKNDFKRLAEMAGYRVRHFRDAAKGHSKLADDRWTLVKKAISNFEFEGAAEPVKKSKRVEVAA